MQKLVLENRNHQIIFLNHGATIYQWIVKSKNRNIVLTNADLDDYKSSDSAFLGTTIGRVTNRIRDGKFYLDNQLYQLEKNFDNNLNAGHGGPKGLWNQVFQVDYSDNSKITFKHIEKDLEAGFPGDLWVTVTYLLHDDGLEIQYQASTTKKTIINLTNHTYFNLSGEQTILNHRLKISSHRYLMADATNAVTGEIVDASNTKMDLRKAQTIKDIFLDPALNTNQYQGLDHCYLLDEPYEIELAAADLKLIVTTTYPAVQVYTMGFPPNQKLLDGKKPSKYKGIALECQFETDAINHRNFSNIIYDKNQTYFEKIIFQIQEKGE
ncbi:MAG: aldose epimerase family protein [Acholeplasmataceae bacterium]